MTLAQKLKATLVLPPTISAFERHYLGRMNRVALAFFWAHLLVLPAVGALSGVGALEGLLLTLGVLVGPTVAGRSLENPRHVSLVMGVASMAMGGVLVHLGQGSVQIEMHFYSFATSTMPFVTLF